MTATLNDEKKSEASAQFEAAGWHVVTVKYGSRLRSAFAAPGGGALRQWIDDMSNEYYEALLACGPGEVRSLFLDGAPPEVRAVIRDWDDATLAATVLDLGGHDIASLVQRGVHLHYQRLGAARGRRPSQPLRAPERGADRRVARQRRSRRQH